MPLFGVALITPHALTLPALVTPHALYLPWQSQALTSLHVAVVPALVLNPKLLVLARRCARF